MTNLGCTKRNESSKSLDQDNDYAYFRFSNEIRCCLNPFIKICFLEMAKYIPEGGLDPSTFHDVMDAANIKYYLAKVNNICSYKTYET